MPAAFASTASGLIGLFGNRSARWGAINLVLHWAFFATLSLQLATGGLLYFGHTEHILVTLHWLGTWAILACAALHVFAHWKFGGAPQLLRMFRPAPLVAPPPPLDPVELLVLLAERTDPPAAAAAAKPADRTPGPARTRDSVAPRRLPPRPPEAEQTDQPTNARTLPRRARALAMRAARRGGEARPCKPIRSSWRSAIAIVGAFFLVRIDRNTVDTLYVRRIDASEAPVLDGDTSDPIWRAAPPLYVATGQGGNFDGTGQTTVEIRAVHDGKQVYFLFTWDDPTRSLKQLPLIKQADGWHLLHDGYEVGDEHAYNEDKFAVLLTAMDVVLAGDRTFHAGSQTDRRGAAHALRTRVALHHG